VFGASGGIGSALSKRLLAQPGATVVVAGRDEGRLQQLVSSIGGGVPLVGDPCDPKQVRDAVAAGTSVLYAAQRLRCCRSSGGLGLVPTACVEHVPT
jgi:NADP-dependent 3-hydroxy acid dehydrogenase YdfG